MKTIKNTQKIRLVMNGVHFHTTAKQIRYGIGDEYRSNAAAQKALLLCETSGFCGFMSMLEGIRIQIDLV